MTLVAGIDSSTQSCKIVIRDAASGELVREGRAPHPPGTEVDPEHWWRALERAIAAAGGLDDVDAVAVAGQQHGLVCLDEEGRTLRPALLWNDTRSAGAAADLVAELGAAAWAEAVGSVPVASLTVAKLRWLATHEPLVAKRVAAVCLPHDWLTWRLGGAEGITTLVTDRGDASGTGYWSPETGHYRADLVERALGHRPLLPGVVDPDVPVGTTSSGALLGPGTGDNMAAALGLGVGFGELIVSVGTSAVVSARTDARVVDPTGIVAAFADAQGAHLPLVCTLNGAGVLDAMARLLNVGLDDLAGLALATPSGAGGLTLVPYLAGERTPNRPQATGALHGLTAANAVPAYVARAVVEGLLCGVAAGIDALAGVGIEADQALLIGGGARSVALQRLAPAIFGRPVVVPQPGEYVADGAARQAAWVLAGTDEPPAWPPGTRLRYEADPQPEVIERYQAATEMVLDRPA